ncbi:MAG: type II toxin-antitoxin system HicA family toxin [Synergistaceae bacterium]|jgi:predicted RNA binding protein YcfA (HicA-like mRNA interferase family)|nr:type II toxin-antitoxin system HicA family toxin [Synergistaceae bacterium]
MGFTITEAELIAFLASKGFRRECGGKHPKMVKGKLRVPIPAHRGDMCKGTVNDILNQAGYTVSDVLIWRRTK